MRKHLHDAVPGTTKRTTFANFAAACRDAPNVTTAGALGIHKKHR